MGGYRKGLLLFMVFYNFLFLRQSRYLKHYHSVITNPQKHGISLASDLSDQQIAKIFKIK